MLVALHDEFEGDNVEVLTGKIRIEDIRIPGVFELKVHLATSSLLN